MVTGMSILYSAAAVRRILGLSSSAKVQIQIFDLVVWVWVKGKRPTFISKKLFKSHFATWRQEQAKGLKLGNSWQGNFQVLNPKTERQYIVEARSSGVFCTCEDFNNQLDFWGRGCCKHGYAVLNHLGFGSLGEFLTAQKVVDIRRASEAPAAYAA